MPKPKQPSQSREPLTRARIEDAAFALIEEEGLAELSFRKLGERLGCQAMSIYHHLPGKGHLLDALVERALGGFHPIPPGEPWQQRIRKACAEFRAVGLRNPRFFQYLALHRLNTPNGLKLLQNLLSIFQDAGFDAEMTARCFRLTGYYLMGAILDETNGYAKGPSAMNPPTDAEIARDYPAVVAASPYFRGGEIEPTFWLGLELLISGFERELAP